MFLRRTLVTATLAGLTAPLLAGCGAPQVSMEPAPLANDPACADVIVRLEGLDDVAGHERRGTNAQSTGAWGNPAAVLLVCGIEPMGPTTLPCVNVNGIDWVIDDSNKPMYRFEAYGRYPGLEVIVDGDNASGTEALLELGQATAQLPQERQCTDLMDTLDFG